MRAFLTGGTGFVGGRLAKALRERGDEVVCLVRRPEKAAELDDDLVGRIRRRIREDCSPRHVPNEIVAIAEVPRTLSGKVLEVPVKRILTGTPPEQAASRESLKNPAALDPFVALAGRDVG